MKACTPWTSLLLAALCAAAAAQTTTPSKQNTPTKPGAVPPGVAASAPMKGPSGPGAQGGPAGGEHRGPPPEALAACKSLKADAACSFTSPHGAVQGRCWAPPDKPLACKPDRPKGASPQAPQR